MSDDYFSSDSKEDIKDNTPLIIEEDLILSSNGSNNSHPVLVFSQNTENINTLSQSSTKKDSNQSIKESSSSPENNSSLEITDYNILTQAPKITTIQTRLTKILKNIKQCGRNSKNIIRGYVYVDFRANFNSDGNSHFSFIECQLSEIYHFYGISSINHPFYIHAPKKKDVFNDALYICLENTYLNNFYVRKYFIRDEIILFYDYQDIYPLNCAPEKIPPATPSFTGQFFNQIHSLSISDELTTFCSLEKLQCTTFDQIYRFTLLCWYFIESTFETSEIKIIGLDEQEDFCFCYLSMRQIYSGCLNMGQIWETSLNESNIKVISCQFPDFFHLFNHLFESYTKTFPRTFDSYKYVPLKNHRIIQHSDDWVLRSSQHIVHLIIVISKISIVSGVNTNDLNKTSFILLCKSDHDYKSSEQRYLM
ncbi:hypothetical protein HZS_4407, partial [Henneguya salminicola]